MTGAKQSCLDHSCASRLPRTTILYLACTGAPEPSYLMVEMAIVGITLPTSGRKAWYSSSVMTSQVSMSTRPSYSALYDASQISWSLIDRRWCLRRVGVVVASSSFASTLPLIIS